MKIKIKLILVLPLRGKCQSQYYNCVAFCLFICKVNFYKSMQDIGFLRGQEPDCLICRA